MYSPDIRIVDALRAVFYGIVQATAEPWRSVWDGAVRLVVFTCPLWLWLKQSENEKFLSCLSLDDNMSKGLAWGLCAGSLQITFNLARLLWFNGLTPDLALAKLLPALVTSLTIATFVEEIAFRGFLLQCLARAWPFWVANIVSATLFVAIHFPGWVLAGDVPLLPGRLLPMCEIFMLGVVNGWLLRRSGSLWAPILLHATNNAIAMALFTLNQ